MSVKKAVIPVAGKGTRFLPATKQIGKEIIPILNKPMIHYIVEEAVESGIEQVIFITSYGKEAIENYFDRNLELEEFLLKKGKVKEYELIRNIGEMTEIISVRQKEQLGLGHAVACAESVVGREDFVVLLPDEIILSKIPVTKQLIELSRKHHDNPVVGVMEIDPQETEKYGVIEGRFIDSERKTLKMLKMVEKPQPSVAPSNLATPGRYVLPGEIFQVLKNIPKGTGGEYQLTDAINLLCQRREVMAHLFEGNRFDTGNVLGYLEATIECALRDKNLREDAIKIMFSKLKNSERKL